MKTLATLFFTFFATLAFSDDLSDVDIQYYLKESSAKYSSDISKIKTNKDLLSKKDIEPNGVLYASLAINKNLNDALKIFAEYFDLDIPLAQVAAQEIITAYKIQENCNKQHHSENCPPTEFNARNIQTLNNSKKADKILFDIASTINYREELTQLIAIIGDNEKLLLQLFDYTHSVKYLVPLTKGMDTPNEILINASLKTHEYDTRSIDKLALNAFILKKNGTNDFDRKIQIQNHFIVQLLSKDMNIQAIDTIKDISKSDLESYVKSKINIFNCENCEDLSNELIAYQLANNNFIEATKLTTIFPLKSLKSRNDVEIRQFLLNVINPTIDRKSLYSWMIYGNALGKRINTKSKDPNDYEHIGWLTSFSGASPIIRKVAYQYFEKVEYPEFARYMKDNHRYGGPNHEFELTKGLGEEYQKLVTKYDSTIKNAKSVWIAEETTSDKDGDYKLLSKFTEKSLPLQYQNQKPIEPDLKSLPTPMPMSEGQIIRAEKFNDEWYVIYVSSALDPTGEVPAPGYWLIKTYRHGIIWGNPVYLGMQMYFPYEILPNAPMPMLSEHGLDLQADIKELDTESITFPPVGLFFKREKTNLVIHIELDELFKDSDQDGLTDILEMKIGSNPNDLDTDKDGFVDGTDTLPSTPFDKKSIQYNQLAMLLLNKIVGIDERAITVGVAKSSDDLLTASGLNNVAKVRPTIDAQKTLFLTGNKEIFKGLDIPFRLVFVDEKLPVNTGFSLPTDIGWVFPNADHTEYYIIWNAHWAGGSFIVRFNKGKMKIETVSDWIT